MANMHSLRGQTFPIWLFGTLTALCLLGFATNYGNILYWQIRAQNAADAASQGALSIQATHLNQTIATLHAAAVEEYRMRHILNDIVLVLGTPASPAATQCTNPGSGTVLMGSCNWMYTNLRENFIAAANRYTADVNLIENTDEPTLGDDEAAIAKALVNFTANCGTVKGGDCGFNYTLVAVMPRDMAAIEDVYSDCCQLTVGGGTIPPAILGTNANLLPLEIEVVACATVPPLFPQAGTWIPGPTFSAVGRAAATTVMATQEFMELGAIGDPVSGSVFQPSEYPESTTALPGSPALGAGGKYDELYRIDYGGNPSFAGTTGNIGNPETSNVGGTFQSSGYNPAMTTYTGWWTTVAEESFAGPISSGQYTCK